MNFLPPASLVAETLENVSYLVWILGHSFEVYYLRYCRNHIFFFKKIVSFVSELQISFSYLLLFLPSVPRYLVDRPRCFLFSSVIPISPGQGPVNWITEIQTGFPSSHTFSVLLLMFCNIDGALFH